MTNLKSNNRNKHPKPQKLETNIYIYFESYVVEGLTNLEIEIIAKGLKENHLLFQKDLTNESLASFAKKTGALSLMNKI